MLIWAWIGRTLFLYHYMASVYFGYLALALVLAECFKERAEPWEHLALLLTMAPAFFLGLGPVVGLDYVRRGARALMPLSLMRTTYAGRLVAGVFVGTGLDSRLFISSRFGSVCR